jgi:FKBP-type peptidyl-prolyl cis-trans isomerase FkpA
VEVKASESFLATAAAAPGAQKLESGLVYLEVAPGSGASPTSTDTVKVHYHGTLRDGAVFDSSVERGTPAQFPLAGVIPCWTEGVQKMMVGGKSKLVCPSDTAYGDAGQGPIPGGAALVFEVELLGIE